MMNLSAAAGVMAAAEHYIEFPKLGIRFDNVNTSVSIGSFNIAWYGIIICAGMIICMILGMLNCHRINLSRDNLTDYLLAAIPSAIVGARLYYVIFEWDSYKDNPIDIIKIWNGGLAIYGGLIGAAVAIIIMAKIKKHSILDLLDFAMPHIFLGQAIGRWGNFINQEAFGRVTDLPWGMTGDKIDSFVVSELKAPSGSLVHPTFLYESLWCFIGFIILYIYFIKFRKGKGEVLALYFFIYGLERAVVEGLRIDSLYIGGVRVSQLLSVLLVFISVPFFIDCRKKFHRDTLLSVSSEATRTKLSDLADKVRTEEIIEDENSVDVDSETEDSTVSESYNDSLEDNGDSSDKDKAEE
ncbi:MAG: prolipoprotein diacylglyceryl transferase [Clostridia bacterium]|nr:prolipoprotein diacylglyceryl transferase [Clostridia bacterium]